MKRLLNKAFVLALMAATWVGCSQEDYYLNSGQESESDITISLKLSIPDPVQVVTRSGVAEAIENITILCFDKNGGAIPVKEAATFTSNAAESGTLTATIPNATRVMHVFANQANVPFEKGMSEYDERLTNLTATSDKMVYWGRIEVPSNLTSASDLKNFWANTEKSISLLRSMAKVEVVNNNTDEFTLLGYTVVNTSEAGMAIPYYVEDGVYPYTSAFSQQDWIYTDYIHAATDGTVSGTDETMQTSGPIYVYETSASTPASIIIKGYNNDDPDKTPKYWRVAFAGEDGEQINIRRNHLYTVSIEGHVLFGDTNFDDAVANSSTANSAWLGIAPEVTAIKNNKFSLTVENTSYVMANGEREHNDTTFKFVIEQLGDEPFAESELSVKWEDSLEVYTASVNYTSKTTTGENGKTSFEATVNVPLIEFDELLESKEGTIVIKYGKKLQRKVKVIIIPQQTFNIVSYNDEKKNKIFDEETGAWVYTVSVNKADYEPKDYTIDGAPIDKLKFTLPINFPEELLPLNVLVSTTDFNVVNSPLIFEGAGGYGDKSIGPGYKYVYPVSEMADEGYEIQLRYINNLLADKVELTLEAENFNPVKLIIKYTTESTGE